jgi:hypothetical protein
MVATLDFNSTRRYFLKIMTLFEIETPQRDGRCLSEGSNRREREEKEGKVMGREAS